MWRTPGSGSSVRSFGVCPAPGALTSTMRSQSLRGKAAAVVVGVPRASTARWKCTSGRTSACAAEALRTLADDGVPTRGVWADIAPAGPADGVRMPVVVSAASAKQMAEALQPLTAAGIRVRTAMTPAAALAAIARSRRAFSVPDTTEAYVALDRHSHLRRVDKERRAGGRARAAGGDSWTTMGTPAATARRDRGPPGRRTGRAVQDAERRGSRERRCASAAACRSFEAPRCR